MSHPTRTRVRIARLAAAGDYSPEALAPCEARLHAEFGRLLRYSRRAVDFARYRRLFSLAMSMGRGRIERRAPSVIRRKTDGVLGVPEGDTTGLPTPR